MVLFNKCPDTGNLILSFDPDYGKLEDAKADLKELVSKVTEAGHLNALLEDGCLLGNDWWGDIQFTLSEAPAIGYGAEYSSEDLDYPDTFESVWYWERYQLESWSDVLIREGKAVFTRLLTDLPFSLSKGTDDRYFVMYRIDGEVKRWNGGTSGVFDTGDRFRQFVKKDLSEGYKYRPVEKVYSMFDL